MVELRLENYESVEADYVKVWLEDGVVSLLHKDVDVLTLSMAKQAVAARKLLMNGREYPIMIDLTKAKVISRDARAYFATKESAEGIVKGAFIVNSSWTRLLFNFFVLVYKPEPPSRMFYTEVEALAWLKQEL